METLSPIKKTPIYPHFGATIEGIDVNNLSKEDITYLRNSLNEHQLLILKAHTLSPKEQVEFSSIFGALETFPYNANQFEKHPEIFRLSTDKSKGYQNVGFYWHQDGSFNQIPTPISIFHLTEIPKNGGETLLADAQKVYTMLPDELKNIAENLKTNVSNSAIHDLVIEHPMTKKKGIYLNYGLTQSIFSTDEHVTQLEIKAVIDKITQYLELPDVKYRHKWEEGDIVIADNYAVFHQATPTLNDSTRTLHRTTIKGEYELNRS
ncbi:TauD/TfdA family dioxygenase [Winogradskyella sp.]|uniref:TauD/TfdA dioxygenase family protein n=1 Tax=Winogradskyella sp. TaxID=1883156 RepID=UPI0026363015|nr:TauD/TfdA family dioxygenase [Winogradskyella sp.]